MPGIPVVVGEESPGEDPEGAPEDGSAEGPGADVEVWVVVLEEVAGVVRPAVASSVPLLRCSPPVALN